MGEDCDYDRELGRLQIELVKLHEWIQHDGLKVVILFEGRDAAGKGSTIKRITEELNPRICRLQARWCSFTGVGTTGAASNTSSFGTCYRCLLSMIPYRDLTPEHLKPPLDKTNYVRPPIQEQNFIPELYMTGE